MNCVRGEEGKLSTFRFHKENPLALENDKVVEAKKAKSLIKFHLFMSRKKQLSTDTPALLGYEYVVLI